MTELPLRQHAPAFPPASYKRLSGMMKRGQGYQAPGPCAIPGCTWLRRVGDYADTEKRVYRGSSQPLFVWDHCHAHDCVRGILCRNCNGKMAAVDSQHHWLLRNLPGVAELLAYWERCPECAAFGPWQPVMVRHSPSIVRSAKRTIELAIWRAEWDERRAAEQRAEYARRSAAAMKGVATRRARKENTA